MAGARVIATIVFVLAASCIAQEHPHEKGERLGAVHFATSCNEGAQREFDRAVALLHSFQFSRAIEGFNAVLGQDPTGEVVPAWRPGGRAGRLMDGISASERGGCNFTGVVGWDRGSMLRARESGTVRSVEEG